MSDANPYFDEIQAVNAEVEAWYSGAAQAGALDHLMAHFSPQFSMILPNGGTLDWPTLREIFAQHGGQRPELQNPDYGQHDRRPISGRSGRDI